MASLPRDATYIHMRGCAIRFACLAGSDGEQYVAGSRDKTLRIYDDASGALVVSCRPGGYETVGHSNRIFSVKYHPRDANRIASGGWDSTVIFWDVSLRLRAKWSTYIIILATHFVRITAATCGLFTNADTYRSVDCLHIWTTCVRRLHRPVRLPAADWLVAAGATAAAVGRALPSAQRACRRHSVDGGACGLGKQRSAHGDRCEPRNSCAALCSHVFAERHIHCSWWLW